MLASQQRESSAVVFGELATVANERLGLAANSCSDGERLQGAQQD